MIIHTINKNNIIFGEEIHGFRTERGTGTAIMNVKLITQKVKRESSPYYMIFLDMSNKVHEH